MRGIKPTSEDNSWPTNTSHTFFFQDHLRREAITAIPDEEATVLAFEHKIAPLMQNTSYVLLRLRGKRQRNGKLLLTQIVMEFI
jgi:hypothetical protein